MKVILLQNTIIKGSRYTAGAEAEFSEDVARKLAGASLAYIPEAVASPVRTKTDTTGKETPKPKSARKGAK